MHAQRPWQESIRPGFQVFAKGGSEEFGAVRDFSPDGRNELLISVENGGDRWIPLDCIVDVHDEKVIVDLARLSPDLRSAVGRAHDAEVGGL
jgi:hypothetical protein